jgi:hypothetical protein
MKVYLAERVDQEWRRDVSPVDLASVVREPEAPYGVAPRGTHRAAARKRSRKNKRAG